MSTLNTPTAEGSTTGIAADPNGAPDETSDFVLDAFEQLTNDGDQYELPEVHQPPVSEEPVVETPAAPVQTPPQGVTPPVQQVQATPPPVQPQAVTPPQGAVEQPGVVQQPTPPVAAQTPQPPVQAAQVPATIPQVPQQAPSGPAPGDFSAIAEGLKQSEKIFTAKLAETEYALTKEEKDALGFDDTQAAAVASLAARTHVNAVGTVLRTIAQQMPAMMNRHLQVQNAAKGAEDAFYGQWPQLKEHSQTVMQLGQAYRNAHPTASQDDFIKMVGAMSVTALGLHVQTPPTAQPQVPQVQVPGRIVGTRPQAFQPAGAANAPANGRLPQTQANPWEEASMFILNDDAGTFDR